MVSGDIGTVIELTITRRGVPGLLDLSGATALSVEFVKGESRAFPQQTITKAATSVTAGRVRCTSAGEFSAGKWSARAVVATPGWSGSSTWFDFIVTA